MELNNKDWQMLIDTATREFGEDIAMDGIERLLRVLRRGTELENPLGLLRTICLRRNKDLYESMDGVTEIQMSVIQDSEEQGYGLPSALHDTRDPYEIIAAREELEIIERDYPELIQEALSTEENIEDRIPSTIGDRMFYYRKEQAWKESKERRAV